LTRAALSRISVTPPYFALTDLEFGVDGALIATIPPSPPPAPEVGTIEAAQASRHLAILGSCAVAFQNESDQRHHYLAIAAEYERVGPAPTRPIETAMWATAQATWKSNRSAVATMVLFAADGEVLNRLRVTYAVLKSKMFRRLNPMIETARSSSCGSSERTLSESSRGRVVADCGPVPMSLCAGHFPGHPAAPVALVMGRLALTTRDALCSQLGFEVAYRLETASVEATGLAQPGQQLVLHAEYDHKQADGSHVILGRAVADGVQVGAIKIAMAALPVGVIDALAG